MSATIHSIRSAEEVAAEVFERVEDLIFGDGDMEDVVRVIEVALNEAFNPGGDRALAAKATSFAVGIASAIEISAACNPGTWVREADHAHA